MEMLPKLHQSKLYTLKLEYAFYSFCTFFQDTKTNLQSFREKMGQAFDFALDKMGIDLSSYSIYNDYVQFLKGVDAQGNYAENQKISAVRRVYQRGILIPMANIESFWKDYLNYEQVYTPNRYIIWTHINCISLNSIVTLFRASTKCL